MTRPLSYLTDETLSTPMAMACRINQRRRLCETISGKPGLRADIVELRRELKRK